MNLAKSIHDFIDALFPNRIVIQLRSDLADAKRERDYFRQRAERLELRLIPETVVRPVRPPANASPVGRKTWLQVQAENQEKIKREISEEAQKDAVKGAH